MSEYLDTTREQLVYEIDVDVDKVKPKEIYSKGNLLM